MSDRSTPITRRSVIRTGTLSALGVGLMTAAGGAPMVQAAAPSASAAAAPTDLLAALTASVQDDESWAEWVTEWHVRYEEIKAKHVAITEQLKVYVPADRLYELVGKLSDISDDWAWHESDRTHELMIRHMPGLEPVLRLLMLHAMNTHFDADLECGQGHCSDGWR